MALIDTQCMAYRLPLLGNPGTDLMLRNKYIGAFGDACYMSEVGTFDCFYKTWQAACADAVEIGELAGNQPWDTGYTCQPVGNGDYTLQIGPDVALKITINYQHAPRQTPLIEVNGTPTAVSGPYRSLPDPPTVEPGEDFECVAAMNPDGTAVSQRERILQMNRKAHAGKVHSDLAGFTWPCGPEGSPLCKEPTVLPDPMDPFWTSPEVHHVVPKKDKRLCAWGTNSNQNAAVISRKLNNYFSNNAPPAEEITTLNSASAYPP